MVPDEESNYRGYSVAHRQNDGDGSFLAESPMHILNEYNMKKSPMKAMSEDTTGMAYRLHSPRAGDYYSDQRDDIDLDPPETRVQSRFLEPMSSGASVVSATSRSHCPSVILSESQMLAARESALRILKEAKHDASEFQHLRNNQHMFSEESPRHNYKRRGEGNSTRDTSNFRDTNKSPKGVSPYSVDETKTVRRRNASLIEENNNLKLSLSEAESRATAEASRVKKMGSTIEQLEGTIEELRRKIGTLEEKVSERDSLKSQVKQHIDSLEKDQELTKRKFEEKLEENDETIKKLERMLGDKESTVTLLQSQVDQFRTSLEEVQSKRDEELSAARKEGMMQSQDLAESLKRELSRKIELVEQEKQAIEDRLKAQLSDSLAYVKEMKDKYDADQVMVEEEKKRNAKLVKELQKYRETLGAKEQTIVDRDTALQELTTKLDQLTLSLERKENNVKNLKKQTEDQIEERNKIVSEFSHKLSQKDNEIRSLDDELRSQKKSEESLREEFERELFEREKEKQGVEDELAKTLRFLEGQDKHVLELSERNKQHEAKEESLEKKVSGMKTDLKETQKLLEESEDTVNHLRKESTFFREKFKSSDEAYGNLSDEFDDAKNKHDQLVKSHESYVLEAESLLKESEANVDCLKRERVRCEEDLTKLEREFSAEKRENSSLREEMRQFASKTEEAMADLRREKEQAENEAKSNARQIAQKEKNIKGFLKEIELLEDQNGILKQKAKELEEKLHQSHDDYGLLEKSLASEKQTVATLRSELRQLAAEMEENMATHNRRRNDLETSNSALRGEVQGLSDQLSAAEEKAALLPQLEDMLQEAQDNVSNLKREFASLQRQSTKSIDSLQREVSDLEKEKMKLAKDLDDRAKEVEISKARSRQFESDLRRSEQDIKALEGSLDEEKLAASALRSELRQLTDTMEDEISAIGKEKEMLQREVSDYSRRLTDQERYIQTLTDDLDQCKADRAELNDQALMLEKELSRAEKDLLKAQQDAEDAHYRTAEMEKDIAQVEEELQRFQRLAEDSQYRCEELEKEYQRSNELVEDEIARAEAEAQRANRRAKEAQYRCVELEKELQQNNDLLDRIKHKVIY